MVVLISPPTPSGHYSADTSFPPLGLAYLASVLESEGFPVKIIDMAVSRMGLRTLDEELRKDSFEIVGITSMIHTHPIALRVARLARQAGPNSLVVMGGIPATFADIDTLQRTPEIDVVVRGEGEFALLELARSVSGMGDVTKIKGITRRAGHLVVRAADREPICNLDSLPFPSRHLLQMSEYLRLNGTVTVSTSRGCPFRCAFCSVGSVWGHRRRCRSVDNIMKEIHQVLDDYQSVHLMFVDDTFTLDKKHTAELCDAMRASGIRAMWSCTTRADCLNAPLVKRMSQAGCGKIAIGVESGSQSVVDRVNKGTSLDTIKRAAVLIKSHNIQLKMNFIYGLPGETEEDLQRTFDFIEEVGPDEMSFNKLTQFPGTPPIAPSTQTAFSDDRVRKELRSISIPVSQTTVGYAFPANHRTNSSEKDDSTSGTK